MRRAALFLASVLTPAALVFLFTLVPVGCDRPPVGGGTWADPPPAFTPEPPSPHPIADDWDASVPSPRPTFHDDLPIDRTARKPRQVIGDRRFYCPLDGGGLAVSPDGRLLACGGGDPYTVTLFDPDTGNEVGRLYGHGLAHARGGRLAFSPDSKRLYGPGMVWDVAARRGVARLPATDAAWLPAGDWDLTADGTLLVRVESVMVPWVGPPGDLVPLVLRLRQVVRVWDTRTWAEVEAWAVTGMRPPVAISPDGRYVALGAADGVVRVWDRRDRKELPALVTLSEKPPGEPAHFRREVTHLVFSPDGKTLAGASGGHGLVTGLRHVALWSWPDGALTHNLPLYGQDPSDPWSLVFTPDGRHVLATGRIKSVAWEVATGTIRGEREHKHGWTYGPAAVAPDGRRFFTTGPWWRLSSVSVPDLVPIPLEPPLPDAPPEPPFATYKHPTGGAWDGPGWRLPDGTRLRCGGVSTYGVLHLDAEGKLIRHYLPRKGVGFDVTADGKLMATYGHDDTPGGGNRLPLQFWDRATGAELAAVTVHPPWPFTYQPRFSPDGTRLAMLHTWNLVRVWDVAAKVPVLSLDPDGVAVTDLTYSADGRFLIGTSGSGPAVVWDATGGK